MLAGLARVSLTGLAQEPLPALAQEDAAALAALAVRTRMTGPCQRAFSIARTAMPPPLAEAVRHARARAAVSNGRVLGLARIAFPILASAGIPAIAFKGPFQHRQIHGDPFFCRSGDLDLLVARADFAAALASFEAAGFTRRGDTSPWWTRALGEVHLVHPQGGVIDLHHRLQQPGSPPPADLGAFLSEGRRETIGGVAITFPGLVDTVLICALNLAKEFAHRKPSARYAYDLAAGLLALAACGESAAFAEAAVRQRLSGTVGFAAALAGRIFALDLPLAPPLAALRLPPWASRAAVLAMAFAPEAPGTPWPRRRAVLWALCSDAGPARRSAEFAREQARIIASEALRRAAGSGGS
ncbi:nucleotidyltransferase family protein [Erythrobacter sp. NE805]|uniref:nucleotidyltransferase family protein n=1 Tax=Erythrobacter sp. NE805 TaxID=3389875 RepID=UPI00396AF34D